MFVCTYFTYKPGRKLSVSLEKTSHSYGKNCLYFLEKLIDTFPWPRDRSHGQQPVSYIQKNTCIIYVSTWKSWGVITHPNGLYIESVLNISFKRKVVAKKISTYRSSPWLVKREGQADMAHAKMAWFFLARNNMPRFFISLSYLQCRTENC